MNSEKAQKIEKITGYALLVIGLIFIVIPAILALSMFLSGSQIPQFVPIPTGTEDESAKAFAVFSSVCLVFFVFIIMAWAGSIISSRGVTMIKDVRLKLVRRNLEEVEKTAKKSRKS